MLVKFPVWEYHNTQLGFSSQLNSNTKKDFRFTRIGSPFSYFLGAYFFTPPNTWFRRRIALINDSGILSRFNAEEIATSAQRIKIDISVENGKLVIPADKEKMKNIISFLDEEAYIGPFSKLTYITNSKRAVKSEIK